MTHSIVGKGKKQGTKYDKGVFTEGGINAFRRWSSSKDV